MYNNNKVRFISVFNILKAFCVKNCRTRVRLRT